MINVKLLVLFLCVDYIREISAEYCEICPKHTLCMYKNPGPKRSCKFYDNAALLSKDDVQNIVNKINQRRNFVALGLARNLPSAANMNKVEWSEELAVFAQRWVDQCDGVIRPDREDFCRDLADTKVGQNIATVTGNSPGLNVKSFVEIWYIEALKYTGSVTYYNESRESKTNYFTQLIWAETRLVGCGKARFSIDDIGSMVDRLVCNFAPRGNIRGKPVYTIGYPGTQCKDDFQADESFTGLCRPIPTKMKVPETTLPPTVRSLLRILNPRNHLMKDVNIDPIQNDAKDGESTDDAGLGIGHQKIRHAPNQTHLIQHEIPLNLQGTHAVTNSPSRHDAIPYHHTIDHLQNIHGAIYKTKSSTEHHRKHSYIKDFVSPCHDQHLKKIKPYGICTRYSGTDFSNSDSKNKAGIEQCTRGLKRTEYLLITKPQYQTITQIVNPESHAFPHVNCDCNSQKTTCSPSTTQCTCNLNCQCLTFREHELGAPSGNPGEYFYYDFSEPINHGGEKVETRHLSKQVTNSFQSTTVNKYANNDDQEYFTRKIITQEFSNQKARQHSFRRNHQNHKYGVINPRRKHRSKRQTEEQFTDNPFWQVDANNKQPQLKSLRYTTLSNNRRKIFRSTSPYQIWTEETEPITIKIEHESEQQHGITEKFLSFDELMHLRKINGGETGFNIRRGGGAPQSTGKTAATTTAKTTAHTTAATTKAVATTTAKTTKATTTDTTVPTVTYALFKPLKQCSRKATCTWTAPTVTDSEGNVVHKGKGGSGGSRTPPGYVDGCTRTSTCTREFMNRNRLANSTDETENVTPEDEDYCERRSLDLKRKDGSETVQTLDQCETHMESPTHVTNSMEPEMESTETANDCSCTDPDTRSKRNICLNCHKKPKKNKPRSNQANSDDYYYLMLSKFLKTIYNRHKNNPNACSCTRNLSMSSLHNYFSYLLFIFFCIMLAVN